MSTIVFLVKEPCDDETSVPCLFCTLNAVGPHSRVVMCLRCFEMLRGFHFAPNQGHLLSIAGSLQTATWNCTWKYQIHTMPTKLCKGSRGAEVFLGFQSTNLFCLRLLDGWVKLLQAKTRTRTTRLVPQLGLRPLSVPFLHNFLQDSARLPGTTPSTSTWPRRSRVLPQVPVGPASSATWQTPRC